MPFPPVMIDVEAGGQPYREMHVDGGAVASSGWSSGDTVIPELEQRQQGR